MYIHNVTIQRVKSTDFENKTFEKKMLHIKIIRILKNTLNDPFDF